jgi:hypothetical protein
MAHILSNGCMAISEMSRMRVIQPMLTQESSPFIAMFITTLGVGTQVADKLAAFSFVG